MFPESQDPAIVALLQELAHQVRWVGYVVGKSRRMSGRLVKRIRLALGLRQEDWGYLFGLTQDDVARWEAGTFLHNRDKEEVLVNILRSRFWNLPVRVGDF